jgi:hypothetical protein
MKPIAEDLARLLGETPIGKLTILIMISLALFVPAIYILDSFLSELAATAVVTTWAFSLIGILGSMIFYYKEVPVLFFTVKGLFAQILGGFLALFGFGFALWGLIYNFSGLF